MGGKSRKKPMHTISLEITNEQYSALCWMRRKRGKTEQEYLYEAIKDLIERDCGLITHVERSLRSKHRPTMVQLHVLARLAEGDKIILDGHWPRFEGGGKVAKKTMEILEGYGYIAAKQGMPLFDTWHITKEGKALVSRSY